MIRFLESLVLSGHYRSAVTELSRIRKTRRSRFRPWGLVEAALLSDSSLLQRSPQYDSRPEAEFAGQSSRSFAAGIPDCGGHVGALRSVQALKSDL